MMKTKKPKTTIKIEKFKHKRFIVLRINGKIKQRIAYNRQKQTIKDTKKHYKKHNSIILNETITTQPHWNFNQHSISITSPIPKQAITQGFQVLIKGHNKRSNKKSVYARSRTFWHKGLLYVAEEEAVSNWWKLYNSSMGWGYNDYKTPNWESNIVMHKTIIWLTKK